jgi:small subunit ribosomal protein S16
MKSRKNACGEWLNCLPLPSRFRAGVSAQFFVMPVKLRLRRQGRTHRPYYHIVAADSRSPRDGRNLEQIGTYDPVAQPAAITVNHTLALKWLKNGAQPTETVRSLLSHEGVMLKLHLHRKGKTEDEITTSYDTWRNVADAKKAALTGKAEVAKTTDERARLEAEKQKSQQRRDKQIARDEAIHAAAAASAAANMVETPSTYTAPAAAAVAEAAPEVVAEVAPVVAEAAPVVAEAAPEVAAEVAPVVKEVAPVAAEAAPEAAADAPVAE